MLSTWCTAGPAGQPQASQWPRLTPEKGLVQLLSAVPGGPLLPMALHAEGDAGSLGGGCRVAGDAWAACLAPDAAQAVAKLRQQLLRTQQQQQPALRQSPKPLNAVGAAAPAAVAISLTSTVAEQGRTRTSFFGCATRNSASQVQQTAAAAAAGYPPAKVAAGPCDQKAAGHTSMPVASSSITPAIAGEHCGMSPPAAVPNITRKSTPEQQQQQQQQQQQRHSAAPVQPTSVWGTKLKQLFSLSGAGTNHPAAAGPAAEQQEQQQQQHATGSELLSEPHEGTEQHVSISSVEAVAHGSACGIRRTDAPVQQQQQQQQLRDQWQQLSDNQDDMQEEQLLGSDAAGHASSVAQLGGPQHTHSDAGDVDYDGHAVLQQQCGDYSGFPVDDEDQNLAQEV